MIEETEEAIKMLPNSERDSFKNMKIINYFAKEF
jgi:hypothetical protein